MNVIGSDHYSPELPGSASDSSHPTHVRRPIDVLNHFPSHDGTLSTLIASRVAVRGEAPFLLYKDRVLSWRQFQDSVLRAAEALSEHGIGKGDRVAAMALNNDGYITLFFAVAHLGAVFVPVNPDLTTIEAGYILGHAEPRAVFCTAATHRITVAACAGLQRQPLLIGFDRPIGDLPDFFSLIADTSPARVKPAAQADDTCLIIYTSGTTGLPKGVMHSHRSYVTAGEAFVERMYLQPEDRLLCILPFFHINALIYSLGGTVASGASIVVVPRFSASRFWDIAESTGATEVNIIAAVGRILAKRPRSEFRPGHRITKLYGAPISADIYDVFRKEFGIPVLVEGYGMTEVPGVCNNPFEGPHRIGSMGRLARHPDHARPFAEMRVVDEDGRDVPDGTIGQLVVRTPIVMQGYFRDPAATAAAFRDGWFLTGDLVYRTPDEFYTFVARMKDIIRRRGENISGAELDNIVSQHPDVLAAATLPVPSELGEDDILIAVIKRPETALTAQEIHDWCADRLNPAKWPRYIAFVESLPYTPSHRVAKHQLRNDSGLRANAIEVAPQARMLSKDVASERTNCTDRNQNNSST